MIKGLPQMLWPIIKSKFIRHTDPFFCTYIITWRCNAKCVMCDVWKKDPDGGFKSEQIVDIFKRLKTVKIVRLSGGEPFLHSGMADIVNGISENTSVQIVHITSNGFLTEAMVDFIKRARHKNIHIKISLNGVNDNYDKVMGIPGAYKKIMRSIEALAPMREKYPFLLGINQTITSWKSYEDSKQIREMCDHYNMPYLPVIAYQKVALYDTESKDKQTNVTFAPFGDFSDGDFKVILDDFMSETNQIKDFTERFVKRYYLKGLYNRLILKKSKPHPKCVALRNHIRIFPNGDIPVCLHNTKIVGNVMDKDFQKTWSSPQVNRMRKWVDACEGCWAECETIPSAIFSSEAVWPLIETMWR